MKPRRPDPITITRAQFSADSQRFARLSKTGVVVTITDEHGVPRMQLSNGGPPSRECRTCGEYVDQDDEAAEDEHGW
jgi:hypothetical protein